MKRSTLPTYRIESEAELLQAFRIKDRSEVTLPTEMRFPVSAAPYYSWVEPSGVRVYLVFKMPKWQSPIGIVFRRDQQGSASSPAGMCEWCLDTAPSDQIGLLSTTIDNKKRVGVNLCLDLSCRPKLENLALLTGQNRDKLIEKLQERIARFCAKTMHFYED